MLVVKLYDDIGTLEWSTSLAAGHIANVVEKVTRSMTRPKHANAAAAEADPVQWSGGNGWQKHSADECHVVQCTSSPQLAIRPRPA